MSIWSGARATPARLDPEDVVEQSDHVVVVEIAAVVAHHERDDRQPVEVWIAENLDIRQAPPALDGAPDKRLLAAPDLRSSDLLLQLEDEPGADRIHDRRRAAFLAML